MSEGSDPPVKQLSLGAAILPGSILADGHSAPGSEAPETWLALLAERHADAAVWQGLLTSSAAGRDFTLQRAPKTTLLLDCGPGQQPQYAKLGQALAKRGAGPGQHTAVRVRVHPEVPQEAEAGLPAFLAGHGSGLSGLHVEFEGPDDHKFNSRNLQASARSKGQHARLVPPPAALPNLRRFQLSLTDLVQHNTTKPERLLTDIKEFLPQLVSLQLKFGYYSGLVISQLFIPGTQAPLLTHLTTDAQLEDQLIELLLGQTPNVTNLTIKSHCKSMY